MSNSANLPYSQAPVTVVDGIPNFINVSQLGELEKRTQTDYDLVADEFYDNAVDWLFKSFYEDEDKVRGGMIDLLSLSPSSRVLEIGCGTGRDSFRIAKRLGDKGIFFVFQGPVCLINKRFQSPGKKINICISLACSKIFMIIRIVFIHSFRAIINSNHNTFFIPLSK